jgi:hypothetical protein
MFRFTELGYIWMIQKQKKTSDLEAFKIYFLASSFTKSLSESPSILTTPS